MSQKLTPRMESALRRLADGHEIKGASINDGEHLYHLNSNTVKALHQRGLIVHVRDHCWGEQFNAQGELVQRHMSAVFSITEAGKQAIAQQSKEAAHE